MDVLASRKFTERSGPSLPSVERPHIFRAPPQSAWTRKKERVTEADVSWAYRPDAAGSDPSRINEAIQYFARGVNPSVEVQYENYGAGSRTTNLHQSQAGSIYKIENVRPPLFPIETLNSISRPRTHQNVTVETNPGIPDGIAGNTIANDIDQLEVINAIQLGKSSGPIPATAYYKLQQPMPMSATWAINDRGVSQYEMITNPGQPMNIDAFVCREESPYGTIIRPKTSAQSNMGLRGHESRNDDASAKVKKETLLSSVRPNFQIVVYDPANHVASEVSANIREKDNIAVQASLGLPITLGAQNGEKIKLKNYTWTAVQTNVGLDQVILTIENPDIHLERNTPLYASFTPVNIPTDITMLRNDEYVLPDNLHVNAETNINLSNQYNEDRTRDIQSNMRLNKRVINNSFDNQGSFLPQFERTSKPQIRLRDNGNRNRAQYAANQAYDRLFE